MHKFMKKFKKIQSRLRRVRGIAQISAIVIFFVFYITEIVTNNRVYLKYANLTAFMYFVYATITAETEIQRRWDIFCCFIFLIFIIL